MHWPWKIGQKNSKYSVVSTSPHPLKLLSAAWISNRKVWRRLCSNSRNDKILADSTEGKKTSIKLDGDGDAYSLSQRSQTYASRTPEPARASWNFRFLGDALERSIFLCFGIGKLAPFDTLMSRNHKKSWNYAWVLVFAPLYMKQLTMFVRMM